MQDEEQHIGYITRELQRSRIQEAISKKSSYLRQEKAKIGRMPILIGAEARLKLLREEAKLKIIADFQNDRIVIGKDTFRIESHIPSEQDGKFVYDLDVAIGM